MPVSARAAAPWLVALAAFAFAIGRAPADPDMYWHLASGKWMVEHREFLRADVFSSTVAGQPYSVGEWLGEIMLYLAYAAAGWVGLILLRGVLVAVAAFFVTRLALRAGARPLVAVPIAVAALLLSTIVWTDRPHLFTLALFPLLLDLLFAAREGRTRLLFAVPPLLLVWTDLHGGYALGLAATAIFMVDALLRRARWRELTMAAALAAIATLLDPGALGLGAAIGHAAAPPRFIVEELPPDVLMPAGFVFALFVLAVLTVASRAGGELIDALLLIPLLWLALSAQRDMPYFAFAAVPYLAARAPWAFAWLGAAAERVRPPRVVGAGLATGVVAMVVVALATVPGAPDERAYPAGAVAAVARGTGTLLNEYDWGGYLIWRAPSRPVFIDGRLFPYLPGVFADFDAAIRLAPGWHDVLARHQVTAALLRPDRPLAGALREDGWRVDASGESWVLLSRP